MVGSTRFLYTGAVLALVNRHSFVLAFLGLATLTGLAWALGWAWPFRALTAAGLVLALGLWWRGRTGPTGQGALSLPDRPGLPTLVEFYSDW